MKNLKKKLSAAALSALLLSMQSVSVNASPIDTGLGNGNGGAVINGVNGGFAGINGQGTGNVDLNFNGNAHVNWDSLNVNKGESLNFNAVNGSNNLTILNTVNKGMSNIYGQINANSGIGQLIIANPNGVLFDGATFTTAGDLMLTTKDLSNLKVEDLSKLDIEKEKFNQIYDNNGQLVGITIKNSDFQIGGEYNIVAPLIHAVNSDLTAKSLRFVTSNGQDYFALGTPAKNAMYPGVELEAVTIDGDVYIKTPTGSVRTTNGGTINGNVNIDSKGSVALNYRNNGEKLTINGDVKSTTDGQMTFVRNADVNGNLSLTSNDGFVDIGDVNVSGNADLKTLGKNGIHDNKYNNFVHVIGNTNIGGDLNIDSSQNIHIGGYDYNAQKLADGKLTVGGNLTAHAHDGHVMTTIDTTAGNKISLKSDNLNVLTDGKATLTAKEYEFSANGYIGGLTSTDNMSVDEKVVNIMENYIHIPDTVGTPGNINIAGGTITAINTPTNANILSKGDVKLTGANAGTINITAPNKYMEITGDVHAKDINVGKETDRLKVDFAGRDYNLNYTNIRDNKVVTVKGNEEVTYELTNGKGGHNDGTQLKGENTYLVGPEGPTPPEPGPDPDPTPTPDPDDNENVKVLRSFENKSVDLNQVYTPVAYAADLDDDKIDKGVRKNVDGSVTVVKAFPMIN